jgi:hypothetical protein
MGKIRWNDELEEMMIPSNSSCQTVDDMLINLHGLFSITKIGIAFK